jgi:hypothetical protein
MSKAPMKTCEKCGAKVHVRRKKCDCGYEFVSKPDEKPVKDAV